MNHPRMKKNLFLAGVGGQGILTAARILGKLAVDNGMNVLVNEIHGMAQRGGVVTCNIRYGDVHAPLIPRGAADILAAFEPVEALRNLGIANEDTLILVNTARIYPFTVALGQEKYPPMEEIREILAKVSERVTYIEANKYAEDAGSVITMNVVLVGGIIALGILPFAASQAKRIVERVLPPDFVEMNLKAFDLGYDAVREQNG